MRLFRIIVKLGEGNRLSDYNGYRSEYLRLVVLGFQKHGKYHRLGFYRKHSKPASYLGFCRILARATRTLREYPNGFSFF